MKACDQQQEDVSSYLDNELPDTDSVLLFGHLASCNACRGFLQSSLLIRNAVAKEPTPEVPTGLDRRVLHIPVQGKRRPRLRAAWWQAIRDRRILVPVPALLASLILFLTTAIFTFYFYDRSRQRIPEPEVVYSISFPTIEVQGIRSPSKSPIR